MNYLSLSTSDGPERVHGAAPQGVPAPGMVLAFELFLLRGSVLNTDHVVAWGVFPICDGQFDIIEGK